jgi:hypothetical protein
MYALSIRQRLGKEEVYLGLKCLKIPEKRLDTGFLLLYISRTIFSNAIWPNKQAL